MIQSRVHLEVPLMRIPEIVPVSDFRRDAAAVLQKVQDASDPVVLTQRGRAVAVLQSIESYEKLQHDLALARALLAGEQDIAAGERHSREEVMKDLGTMLEGGER